MAFHALNQVNTDLSCCVCRKLLIYKNGIGFDLIFHIEKQQTKWL